MIRDPDVNQTASTIDEDGEYDGEHDSENVNSFFGDAYYETDE